MGNGRRRAKNGLGDTCKRPGGFCGRECIRSHSTSTTQSSLFLSMGIESLSIQVGPGLLILCLCLCEQNHPTHMFLVLVLIAFDSAASVPSASYAPSHVSTSARLRYLWSREAALAKPVPASPSALSDADWAAIGSQLGAGSPQAKSEL